jgi:hypothetical protein
MKLQLSAGYYLRFDHIAKLISIIANNSIDGRLDSNNLSQEMGMSPKMIDNLCSYSTALGLRKKRRFELEEMGILIFNKDPFLQNIKTLWFLHYFLTSSKVYIVWNRLVNIILYKNNQITSQKAMPYFQDLIGNFTESSLKRNIPKEINAFFNAYTEQSFSKLNYILKISSHSYRVNTNPEVPDQCILASCYMFRDRYFEGTTGLEIEHLAKEENSPGRIFHISEYQFRLALERLNAKRQISIESRANLDQIRFDPNKNWLDIIKQFYEG